MVNKQQLSLMLGLQTSMNNTVNPHWASAKYNWCTAILAEASEAVDYCGWPWWKKQEVNVPQIKLELVDIWHFILSAYIEKYNINSINIIMQELELKVNGVYIDEFNYFFDGSIPGIERLKLIAASAALNKFEMLKVFEHAMEAFDLTWEELFLRYVAKNTLNIFRQDNGYKEGMYVKTWGKLEDNEVLESLLPSLDINNPDIFSDLYSKLYEEYCKVLAQQI